jgi:hypothetical protein
MHVRSVCSIHIATVSAFGFEGILSMIGPRDSTMTTTLLTIRIEVANFKSLPTTILPFNMNISFFHAYYSPDDLVSCEAQKRPVKCIGQLVLFFEIGFSSIPFRVPPEDSPTK